MDDAGTARLFRRAKLWLNGVPPAVLGEAARTGLLVGRLGLTDPKGNPTCSAGRPPTIEWSADTALPASFGSASGSMSGLLWRWLSWLGACLHWLPFP
ncbi:MAG: DUF5990 family protein [Streptosporangiaceae bacterium]